MKLCNIRVLKGPNIWSTRQHFLLQVRLNTELTAEPPLPYSHYEQKLNAYFRPGENFPEDKSVGNAAELYAKAALRLQQTAGMQSGFFKTKPTAENGIWQVAFAYETEEAARYAAEIACELTEAVLENRSIDPEPMVEKLRELCAAHRTHADIALIANEARRRNIPVKFLSRETLQLGYGKNCKIIDGTSARHAAFCHEFAMEKLFMLLKDAGIPVNVRPIAENTAENATSKFKALVVNGRLLTVSAVRHEAETKKYSLHDVTSQLHPDNRFMAERIAAITGFGLCGIEISGPSVGSSICRNGGTITKIDPAPVLSEYLPSAQAKQKAAEEITEMLYPKGTKSRIPIFAVTGTNGKTTTTRLLRHLVKNSGYCVGYTTTDGVYIGDHEVCTGDCTGPASAGIILRDPKVEFAVLETARGGLLRGGLAFDTCDVAIVTNIQEDHLGLNDINDLEDLAHVKGTVPRSVQKHGWAVLNAEDPHCLKLASEIEAQLVFFSMDAQNPQIQQHIQKGGLATVVEKENVVVYRGKEKITIAPLTAFPLTMNGTAKFMTANILAATAAAFAYGFSPEEIRYAFETFIPNAETTPGRMNLFEMNGYKILVDYAHNTHGVRGVSDYLSQVTASRKIGIVSAVGDRRDKDITDLAAVAAGMFNFIIVRQDSSLRGRKIEEMCALMRRGIQKTNAGVDYIFIDDEGDAIRHAIEIAQRGDFIVALSEDYQKVIEIIETEKQKQLVSAEEKAVETASTLC